MVWRRKRGKRRRGSSEPSPFFGVIEPGSTVLRVLVVEVTDGQSIVWGWAERDRWTGAELNTRDWLAACEASLAQAEEMAQDRSARWFLPDQVLIGLPASQLRGRAWSVVQRRARPERPVDERELTALLGRALRLAVNRLADPDDADWLLIEAVPVAFSVDGRGVTDPVGFRGSEIGATVFAALGRAEIVEAWQLVAERLEFSTLTLTAAPLALASAQSGPQGILVDIGGNTTDLTWWRNGRPVVVDSLHIGGGELTRSLVLKWGLSPERAEKLKRAYACGRLDDEARAQVLEAMFPTLQAWLEETELAFARLNEGEDEPLPERLCLLGGGSALPEVAESVGSLAWSRQLRFARYPQTNRLQATDVPGVVNRTEMGRSEGDVPALALAAWAAHQNRPPDRPMRILSELCQG